MAEDTDRAEIGQALDRLYAYSDELDETWPEGTSKADAKTCFYNIQEECFMLYEDRLSPSSLERLEEECRKAVNMWTQLPPESKTEVMMKLYDRFRNARNRVVLSVGIYVESHPEEEDRPPMDMFETLRSFLEMFDAREDFSNVTPEMEAKMRQWATERNMTLVEGIPLHIQITSRVLLSTIVVVLQDSRRINEEIRQIRQLYSNQNADDEDEIDDLVQSDNEIEEASDLDERSSEENESEVSEESDDEMSEQSDSTMSEQSDAEMSEQTDSEMSEQSESEMSEDESPPLTSGQPVKRKARQNSKPKPKKAKK